MRKLLLLLVIVSLTKQLQAQNGTITTVAGNGLGAGTYTCCYSGDGGQATVSELNQPTDVAVDAAGNLYIVDSYNGRIRKVNNIGIITTFAGDGISGYWGDGAAATAAGLNIPNGVAVDAFGNVYIVDGGNQVIRMVNTAGIITTVAGNGATIYSGDGGQATAAAMQPTGVCVDAVGNVYIADNGNNRIRKVSTTGIITTIAGNGSQDYTGDGGQATDAALAFPNKVALDITGNIYIADSYNQCIRMVNSAGIINTIAGNGFGAGTGSGGYSGDGGQATDAELNNPDGVAVDILGNVYISEVANNRIRKVSTTGIITTIAGNGLQGNVGDGAAATSAQLNEPLGVAVDVSGNLFIADWHNNRIRVVNAPLTIIANSATLCAGDSTNLTATGASTYTWSTAMGLSSSTGISVVANPTVTTTYTITGTTTSILGAAIVTTGTTTTTVTVNSLPGVTTPTITPSNCNQCNGSFVGATGTGGSGAYYYALNGAIYYSYGVPFDSLCAGVFYFAAVDSVTGCYSPVQTYTIATIGLPTVSFTLAQDTAPHTWDAYATFSTNVDSAIWYWGDGDSTIALYPSHTYTVAGLYNICVIAKDTAGCTATYCQSDSVYRTNSVIQINVINNPTGISPILDLNSQVSIYPNPNNGLFNLTIGQFDNLKMKSIEIYNITGECVHRQIVPSANCQIDLSNLNEGVYNISLQSNEGIVNKRLVLVK